MNLKKIVGTITKRDIAGIVLVIFMLIGLAMIMDLMTDSNRFNDLVTQGDNEEVGDHLFDVLLAMTVLVFVLSFIIERVFTMWILVSGRKEDNEDG